MKDPSDLTQRLQEAWNRAVEHNQLINEFQASETDPQGQWVKGDRIVFGIQQQNGTNAYYAHNLTQSRAILSAVEERAIAEIGETVSKSAEENISFTCQFNGYRALRPGGGRKSLGPQPDISPAPKSCRFACQDSSHPLSLLVREQMLQLPLQHFYWNAYYNAAPIEPDGHFLWVPSQQADALTHLPQQLSLPLLEDAFSLFKQLFGSLLFFNSLHSGASVNHIHFQAIAYKQPLLVEKWPLKKQTKKQNYSVLDGYLAPLMVFEQPAGASEVFTWIHQFQQRQIPFNLMLIEQRVILIPRNIEHEIVSEFPGSGIAALGICGRIITVDRNAYLSANKHSLESAFQKMILSL